MTYKKIGLKFKVKDYPNIQFQAGTEDRYSLKACYLIVRGTLESLDDNHKKNIFRFKKQLSGTVSRFIANNKFREQYILTDLVSDSFIITGTSFSTFEFTLFPTTKFSVSELKEKLNLLVDDIYNEQIKDNKILKFDKNLKTKMNGE
jgi:hypothetical protein